MKKIIFPFLALLAVSILPSCSEKFDVAAPYKNITVVYGLLDHGDTAHYIRIQKAFLDNNKSAVAMAKEPDSNFYANLTVVMKMVSMNNGTLRGTIPLTRVDLNNEGYPKQPGLFFNTPNYAYKFKNALDSTLIYRLVITNNATGDVDSAETPIICSRPNVFSVKFLDDTGAGGRPLSFASTNPAVTVSYLTGYYRSPFLFSYNGTSIPVALVQGVLRFNWVDVNSSTGDTTRHYYDYDLGYTGITGDGNLAYRPKNVDIINSLNNGMGPAPAFVKRLMDRCDLTIYLGTSDFNTFMQIQQLQGIGLTGNEIQPTYTNIKGSPAVGLYTARAKRTGKVTIDPATIVFLDSCSLITNARIKGTVY